MNYTTTTTCESFKQTVLNLNPKTHLQTKLLVGQIQLAETHLTAKMVCLLLVLLVTTKPLYTVRRPHTYVRICLRNRTEKRKKEKNYNSKRKSIKMCKHMLLWTRLLVVVRIYWLYYVCTSFDSPHTYTHSCVHALSFHSQVLPYVAFFRNALFTKTRTDTHIQCNDNHNNNLEINFHKPYADWRCHYHITSDWLLISRLDWLTDCLVLLLSTQ